MGAPAPHPETLTIKELTELIDVDKHTVSNWINRGLITVKRGPGNVVAIPAAGIAEYLPAPGDALISPAQIMHLTGWTKAQLRYARRKGRLRAVVMPSGISRYRDSDIAAELRRQRAAAGL